ncbi:MAG: hypothetical protein IJ074_08240, partial [Clostridia bacterium]|nr:hypothetical protein [Clostridia bacterium]
MKKRLLALMSALAILVMNCGFPITALSEEIEQSVVSESTQEEAIPEISAKETEEVSPEVQGGVEQASESEAEEAEMTESEAYEEAEEADAEPDLLDEPSIDFAATEAETETELPIAARSGLAKLKSRTKLFQGKTGEDALQELESGAIIYVQQSDDSRWKATAWLNDQSVTAWVNADAIEFLSQTQEEEYLRDAEKKDELHKVGDVLVPDVTDYVVSDESADNAQVEEEEASVLAINAAEGLVSDSQEIEENTAAESESNEAVEEIEDSDAEEALADEDSVENEDPSEEENSLDEDEEEPKREGAQNEGLTIKLNAGDVNNIPGNQVGLEEEDEVPVMQSGSTVHFEIESALSDSATRSDVEVVIQVNSNGYDLDFDQFGDDGIFKINNTELKMEKDDNGLYSIRYTLTQGDTVNGYLRYTMNDSSMPVGNPIEITVNVEGEEIPQNKELTINGSTEPFVIYNQGSPNWSNINKSANITNTEVKNGVVQEDIVYTIDASPQSGRGTVYTKEYILTDTLELPEELTLISGEGELVKSEEEEIQTYTINGTPVFTFEPAGEGVDIEVDGTTFTYKRTNSSDKEEMEPVNLQVTLHKEGLVPVNADEEWADATVEMSNQVTMEAWPFQNTPNKVEAVVTQSNPVTVKVTQTSVDLQAEKSASVAQGFWSEIWESVSQPDAAPIGFEYYIDVTNTGNSNAENVTIEDEIPVYFTPVASGAVANYYTNGAVGASAVGTVNVSGQQVTWTGTINAGRTVRLTIPVQYSKINAENEQYWQALDQETKKPCIIDNTATVSSPDVDPIQPEYPFEIVDDTPILPVMADKVPALVEETKAGSGTTLFVYDIGDDPDACVNISGDTTVYYMVALYNPNEQAYTYNLSDPRGSGYYGSNNFAFTDADIAPAGTIAIQHANSALKQNNSLPPYGFFAPAGDEIDFKNWAGARMIPNGSSIQPMGTANTGNTYTVLSGSGNVDADILVNGNSYTFVFIPFEVKSAIYNESGLQSTDRTVNNVAVHAIPGNTITVYNKDEPNAPDNPNTPTKTTSETIPVAKIIPDVTLVKAPLQAGTLNRATGVQNYVNNDYVVYQIAITNENMNLTGAYEFLEVLPPYLQVDISSAEYAYSGNAPVGIEDNESFFANALTGTTFTVSSSSSVSPLVTVNRSTPNGIVQANGEPFKLQYNAPNGELNAEIQVYKTTSQNDVGYVGSTSGMSHDVVYIKLDNVPHPNYNEIAYLYLRCKVVTSDSSRGWDLMNDDAKFSYNGDAADDGQQTVVNALYDGTRSDPKAVNDQTNVIHEEFGKYAINPANYEEVMAALNNSDGLTFKQLNALKAKGALINNLSVVPGQEVTYLITYTVGNTIVMNIAWPYYTVTDTLPVLHSGKNKNMVSWTEGGKELNAGEYRVTDAPNNPSIGSTISTSETGITIGSLNMDTSVSNPLALALVTVKLPENIQEQSFSNDLELLFTNTISMGESKVTHNVPTLEKTANPSAVNAFSGTATYEIATADFENVNIQQVALTDDLSATRKYFDIVDIDLGAFAPKDASGKAIEYHVALTDEGGDTHIVSYDALSQGDSLNEIASAAGLSITAEDVVQIEWRFWPEGEDGTKTTVAELSKGNASIEVKLKQNADLSDVPDDQETALVTNEAVLRYLSDKKQGQTTSEAKITRKPEPELSKQMKIESTSVDEDFAYSTENGALKEGDLVSFTISLKNTTNDSINLAGLAFTDTLSAGLEQNCEGIQVKASTGTLVSSTIDFVDGEATIEFARGTLAKGRELTITYSVPVSAAGGEVKNEVSVNNVTATTPVEKAGENAVIDALLQKGVAEIDGSQAELHEYSFVNEEQYGEIVYNAVVFNALDSTLELPVSFLFDELPDDFTFISMSNGNAIEHYSAPSGWNASSSKAKPYAGEGGYTVSGSGQETITFHVHDASGEPVMLAPGEYITFAYKVAIDLDARIEAYSGKAAGDAFESVNTLYLAVDTGADVLNLTTSSSRFTNAHGEGEAKNYGDCAIETNRVDELNQQYGDQAQGWLVSDVSVTVENMITPQVDKQAVMHTWGENSDEYGDGSTKIIESEPNELVKWEITIDNTDGEEPIHNYKVTDGMPDGFVFATDSEQSETYADGKEYTSAQVVYALYEGGALKRTTEIQSDENGQFDLSDDSYDVLPGQKAIITYWSKYVGSSTGSGVFTNEASVNFETTVFSPSRARMLTFNRDGGVVVQDTLKALSVISTSSVKQIILLGDSLDDIKKEGTPDYQARHIEGNYSDGGDTKGNGKGDGLDNGYGNRADNYVVAGKAGDEVGYAIHIQNKSTVALEELVVIDKLPHKGDYGTNNLESYRYSKFTVDYSGGLTIDVLTGLNGELSSESQIGNYKVLFSSYKE